ncbi:hypothetical protein [Acaryochloris marina]|uniref:hypothetical protein n=1 Tax=Acaryochloris marina TaxID=155978 RepID=UPI00030A0601|nr:hypothetical protein [Acaryochloris marina]
MFNSPNVVLVEYATVDFDGSKEGTCEYATVGFDIGSERTYEYAPSLFFAVSRP